MQERAFLVALEHSVGKQGPRMPAGASLRELARLARTAGATVVGQAFQRKRHPDPATYIGSGKIEEIRAAREETGYSVVIFDERLVDVAEKYLRKGSKVYLQGELQTRKWTDQSGAEKYTTEVVCQRFRSTLVMLGDKSERAETPDPQAPIGNESVAEALDDSIPF